MTSPTITDNDPALLALQTENAALRAALGITTSKPAHAMTAKWLELENDMLAHQKALKLQCEELLRTEEGRQKALFLLQYFHSVPLPMWAAAPDATIVHWGDRAAATYQHTETRALGKDFIDLIVVDPEKKQAREDLACIVFGQEGLEHFNLCKDKDRTGKQVFLVTCCFPVYDPRSKQIVQAEVSFDLGRLDSLKEELDEMYDDHKNEREKARATERALLGATVSLAVGELKVILDARRNELKAKMTKNQNIIDDPKSSEHEKAEHKTARDGHQKSIATLEAWALKTNTAIKAAGASIDELEELRRQISARGIGYVPLDN
jgi:hypothetical protein